MTVKAVPLYYKTTASHDPFQPPYFHTRIPCPVSLEIIPVYAYTLFASKPSQCFYTYRTARILRDYYPNMVDEIAADTPNAPNQAQQMNVRVEIVVQPPLTAGVRRRLVPPLVARTDHPQLLDDYLTGRKSVFGTAMLTASNGEDITALLDGNYNVQGQPVTIHPESRSGGGSSSSRQEPHKWIYFIFAGLSIPVPGVYTFTVCVNALVPEQGCVVTVGGKASRAFSIVDQAVAPARPSESTAIPSEISRQNAHWC